MQPSEAQVLRFDARGRLRHRSAGRRLLRALLTARDERDERIWTLERLARACGASVNALHALASGLHREPTLRLAAALHDLGVDWRSWLVP